jgi:hypothetical protein
LKIDDGNNLGSNVARLTILTTQLQKMAANGVDTIGILRVTVQMQAELDQVRAWVLRQESKEAMA